jgi:hypothetical protein
MVKWFRLVDLLTTPLSKLKSFMKVSFHFETFSYTTSLPTLVDKVLRTRLSLQSLIPGLQHQSSPASFLAWFSTTGNPATLSWSPLHVFVLRYVTPHVEIRPSEFALRLDAVILVFIAGSFTTPAPRPPGKWSSERPATSSLWTMRPLYRYLLVSPPSRFLLILQSSRPPPVPPTFTVQPSSLIASASLDFN